MAKKLYRNIQRLSDLVNYKDTLKDMITILAHRNNNYSQPIDEITQKKIVNTSQIAFDKSGYSVPIGLHFRDDSVVRLSLVNGSLGKIGRQGKDGEIGDKGEMATLNTDRSANWLIIANDLETNDNKKVLSALQGVNLMKDIKSLSETYLTEYQYSLLYINPVIIEAEFETFEDMQIVQLISSDPDSHQRYVKYWTYESEGESEYFVLNHFLSTESEKVYDFVYCDLWDDIYLGGTKGYFEATTGQLTDGSQLFIYDNNDNSYKAIKQFTEENGLEFGERQFDYYLPNVKAYVNVDYTLSNGYDYNLDATDLELNIYVMGDIVDNKPTYNKVSKNDVDPLSLVVYYKKLEDGTFEVIDNVKNYIAKKQFRYYKKAGSGWIEVESLDKINTDGFEEYIIVNYDLVSNTNTFQRFVPLETNRGEKYYKLSIDILNNYSITYYIYDDDRQYFTRKITTSTDESGNITFDYEYTRIVIPFWLSAEFVTEYEDMSIRLISNQIFDTEGDEEQITPIYITGIEFEDNNVEIAKNFNKNVKFNINPINANQINLVIEYDENVIEFYEDGRIMAIKSDETTQLTSIKIYCENDPSIYDILNIKIVTPVSEIIVPESNINIYPGTKYQLKWVLNPSQVSNDSVSFETSDESLISISETGLITPKMNINGEINTGNCVVTIKSKDGYNASTSINVLVANPITNISIKSPSFAFVGRQYQLETKITPEDATEKTLEYESSDTSIIEISANGLCTPKAVGVCELTVKSKDGSNVSRSQIVDVNIGVEKIQFIDFDIDTLDVGLSKTIHFEILPENANDKSFDFWVSDESQLSFTEPILIDDNIYETTLTALSSGTPQVVVQALDGTGELAYKDLTVTVPINDITLNYTSLVMYTDDDIVLLKTILNSDNEQPSNISITWHTSNENVASVDKQGRVTPNGAGKCIISAISNDGNGIIASCNVTVKIKVESIIFNDGDESDINVLIGNYDFIKANVKPDYATDQILRWTSGNPDVCTVEDNGTIFGKSIGSAIITATSYDSNVSKSINVNVVEKIENN